jgi:hypothetical protein
MRAAPSVGLDVPSSTPSPTLSPHRASERLLDGVATEEREKRGLAADEAQERSAKALALAVLDLLA